MKPHRIDRATLIARFICLTFVLVASVSAAAAEIVERCGLGPPPDSPAFNAFNEERERIRAQLRYEPVCDQSIATLDPTSYSLESFEKTQSKLAFQPIPLNGTLFTPYRLLGARPDIVGGRSGASALRRYFAGSNGEIIELFEFDTSLGGGVYMLDPKRQTERVKGYLAMLTIKQSKTGKARSVLSWDENRRHIELSINRNVRKDGYAEFIRLAESMPAPTPAQPNAPIPKLDLPPPFGPGPAFPPHPPF